MSTRNVRNGFAVLMCALALLLAQSVSQAATKCDRSPRYAGLSDQDRSQLQQGKMVAVVNKNTGSDFHMAYLYKLVDFDPELFMAVFTSYGEHKGNIRAILSSRVEAAKGNWARVRYELDSGHWYVPNIHYSVNDFVIKDADGSFVLNWDLAWSDGVSKLTYLDGYLRTEGVNGRALIVYCNYSTPDVKLAPDMVNREGLAGMKTTVNESVAWVKRVAADQTKANQYVDRLRQMLGN